MSSILTRTGVRRAAHAAFRPVNRLPTRSIMTLKDHKVRPSLSFGIMDLGPTHRESQYTAHATAQGQGRNGQVKSDDDIGLELRLAIPRSLGGKGDGHNPEQLFAMGYTGEHMSPSIHLGTCSR